VLIIHIKSNKLDLRGIKMNIKKILLTSALIGGLAVGGYLVQKPLSFIEIDISLQ